MTALQPNNDICVICTSDDRYEQAKQFADTHSIAVFFESNNDYELQLRFDQPCIKLFDTTLNTDIHVDFLTGSVAHRERFGGGKGQALAKAIGVPKKSNLSIVDATAGLARDAYVLATLGCKIKLVEQSAILHMLLLDGIERARSEQTTESAIGNILELTNTDSLKYLERIDDACSPDIVYIDPMYPERKKSALVKKEMQVLHKLIGHRHDDSRLLESALQHARYRVVVKRPSYAEPLAGTQPNTSISSKKTRYDIYSIKKL